MSVEPIGAIAARLVNKLAHDRGRAPPFAERIDIADRRQWLELRKKDVTASDAAALLGVHPFKTGYALWAEKTGLVAPDHELTPAMERGIIAETIAIERMPKIRSNWSFEKPNSYYRDAAARLGATPDLFATDPERAGFGIVEIKSVESGIFRAEWQKDGEIEPPLYAAVQTMIQMELCGASWGNVAAIVFSHGIELHLVEIPFHAPLIARVRAAVDDFWKMIEEGKTPEPDYGLDAGLIAEIFGDPIDIEIDLTADNSLPVTVAEYRALGREIAELTQKRDRRRAEILHRLGNAARARIAGGTITAKSTKRKGYVVEPSTVRTIRYREDAA
jgi:putative phage-type endonuclease